MVFRSIKTGFFDFSVENEVKTITTFTKTSMVCAQIYKFIKLRRKKKHCEHIQKMARI